MTKLPRKDLQELEYQLEEFQLNLRRSQAASAINKLINQSINQQKV